MKLSKRRKAILLAAGFLILLFSGFKEEWHALSWFGIHISYDYYFIVKEKMGIIAAIITVAYVLIIMIKDN